MFTISRTRLLTGAATLALTASLGATPGWALTDDATMPVAAQINQACTVTSDGPLEFGPVEPGVKDTATSGFDVSCDFMGNVTIEVNLGLNDDGTFRRMESDEGNFLQYQLYKSSGENDQWNGPDTGVSVSGGSNPFTVFGVVPASFSETAAVGNYEDTVTITVTF